MDHGLVRHLLAYNHWATSRLIEFCAGLPEPNRRFTMPGVYGDIDATLLHLLDAEQRYQDQLHHRPPTEPGTAAEGMGGAGFHGELRRRADELAAGWSEILLDFDPQAVLERNRGGTMFRLAHRHFVLQAFHHGNDHRSHVCTLLGAQGIEPPDIDGWTYSEAIGDLVDLGPASTDRPSPTEGGTAVGAGGPA